MKNLEKYRGIIPAFYACYDQSGEICSEGVQSLTKYFIEKKVKGVYVNGSSGECIYQSVDERKLVLENVMEIAKGKLTVIAHVACNNTKDSVELAKHAENLGVDAIAAIPPIYFHLPDYSIENYWNSMSEAAPNTDFIIYNIPQLAGVDLSMDLYKKMCENSKVIGVKNSSISVQDIEMFNSISSEEHVIFNGPDEQFLGGRVMGASGGIGGTYAVMPELYLQLDEYIKSGQILNAQHLQHKINDIILKMVSGHGNMYAIAKKILEINAGLNLGSVRSPLEPLNDSDQMIATEIAKLIVSTVKSYAD